MWTLSGEDRTVGCTIRADSARGRSDATEPILLPTEREAPADAEALSHKLLVRAGLVRQVGAGLWSWLPAGWRVHQNVVQIVREEIDAIGGQEMLMPVVTPAELWKRSGRWHRPRSSSSRTAAAPTCCSR